MILVTNRSEVSREFIAAIFIGFPLTLIRKGHADQQRNSWNKEENAWLMLKLYPWQRFKQSR